MPWKINEVDAEVHAFDASALLTEEVVAALTARITQAMARERGEREQRRRDISLEAASRGRR